MGNYHRDEVYLENQELFKNIFKATLKKVLNYKKKGKVLEVGSSTGLLLSLFQEKGWEVQGVEPSEKSSTHAIKIGIPTIRTTFEKAKITGKFDVVVLNHVLEHMKNPEPVLRKVNQLLNDKGIVVVNIPNAGSLSAKIYREKWKYRLPEEHLWQFTPNSLKTLLEKTGFSILSWKAKSGIWEFDNPILELWQSLVGFKKRFFYNILTAIPTWFISQFKMGTGLSVIVKKS
ncbi:MAG: class I SAM-dependent methyltransferase [Patescibacteria group bacterium]